jgi:hypothetical protein
MEAILGTMAAPGFLDRLLASRAWEGQMTGEPGEASRPDNLFEPVPGDHGAPGRFGGRSSSRVESASEAMVRGAAAALGVGLVAGLGMAAGAAIAAGRRRNTERRARLPGAPRR